jgi:hypothetical protein
MDNFQSPHVQIAQALPFTYHLLARRQASLAGRSTELKFFAAARSSTQGLLSRVM